MHDSRVHYLSIATTQTSITVPLKPGSLYMWWVHIPGEEARTAEFVTAGSGSTALPLPLRDDQFSEPELIDGRYRCTSLATWSGQNVDVSRALQYCIDRTPLGATLEIPPGQYHLNHQIRVDRRITITSQGKSINDPPSSESDDDSAELIASRALNEMWGMLYATDLEAIHHVIFNGNRTGRLDTLAVRMASTLTDNRYAFNATISADNFTLAGSVFKNALGGTGLLIYEPHHHVTIRDNLFARNGVHTQRNLWADGLTIADLVDSRIEDNRFVDNSDIDLIFGGLVNSIVQGNQVTHTSDLHAGAFGGIMIQKWASTSGNYSGTEIRNNTIDGGPHRNCGSGIYLGSEGWYDQTPYGSPVSYQTGASVHDNIIRNVQNGMYIAATGFSVYDNTYENAHGGTIRTNRGLLPSLTPIVVSPTSRWNDFRGENTAPDTRFLFTYASWRGHIPNWPF